MTLHSVLARRCAVGRAGAPEPDPQHLRLEDVLRHDVGDVDVGAERLDEEVPELVDLRQGRPRDPGAAQLEHHLRDVEPGIELLEEQRVERAALDELGSLDEDKLRAGREADLRLADECSGGVVNVLGADLALYFEPAVDRRRDEPGPLLVGQGNPVVGDLDGLEPEPVASSRSGRTPGKPWVAMTYSRNCPPMNGWTSNSR